MAFEDSAGLHVHNLYGPRKSGGEQGRNPTLGLWNEYMLSLPLAALYNKFPVRNNVQIVQADVKLATGTVSALAIGGVSVLTASEASPVTLAANNTGVVTQTGGTGGYITIRYKNVGGDAFPF